MRDELCGLEFIELTRVLLTSAGDEIDIQIAVFDQASSDVAIRSRARPPRHARTIPTDVPVRVAVRGRHRYAVRTYLLLNEYTAVYSMLRVEF